MLEIICFLRRIIRVEDPKKFHACKSKIDICKHKHCIVEPLLSNPLGGVTIRLDNRNVGQ